MKPKLVKIKIAAGVLLLLTALGCDSVRYANRNLVVVSDPPGATVCINAYRVGTTPFNTNKFRTDIALQVEVRLKDYATEQQTYSPEELARLALPDKAEWRLPAFELTRVHLEVPVLVESSVDGALVFTTNQQAGPTPWIGKLVFDRTQSSPWQAQLIRVTKTNYFPVITNIPYSLAEGKERAGLDLKITLDEIRRNIEVKFESDIPGATVFTNDIQAGVTPLSANLTFTRANGAMPWSTYTVKISKEGYEYCPPGQEATPDFVKKLTIEDAAAGPVSVRGFMPVKFVLVPVRTFEITNAILKVRSTNIMAAVDPGEPDQKPTPCTTASPEDALVASRISAWPDHPDRIVYAKPGWDPRSGAVDPEKILGTHICINDSGVETPLNVGNYFDLDPFVTADGKYIYYSSDRWGKRVIWRMDTNGTLPQPITDKATSLDTEPVVSADGSQLAYTSRDPAAPPSAPSTIWLANADGTQAAQAQPGRNPAWSPDGKKIAFVSPDNKISVMDNKGKILAKLTDGDWQDAYPVWTPSGKQIVFASNRGPNDGKVHGWSLWRMASDSGAQLRQLTQNASFNSCPAVSSDGLRLYFFSNRGAQKANQESLRIFRLNLPQD